MKVNSVNSTNAAASTNAASVAKKGGKIGTAAGFGAGCAYILKNGKDIFTHAAQEGLKSVGSKNAGIAVGAGVSAAFIAVGALIGKAVGTIAGKVIDKHNTKKQTQALNESMAKEQTLELPELWELIEETEGL